jgi:hypothetical protein
LPCSEIGYEALILFAPWCRSSRTNVVNLMDVLYQEGIRAIKEKRWPVFRGE